MFEAHDNKGVEAVGDVIREGGGALGKGILRGISGIVTKPIEGAIASGVEGFVQGVGRGIIGAAAQPVSGALDLLSITIEGANSFRSKIASAIASEDELLRRRLPRSIGGDNLLRPYDEYRAKGQGILQLAECRSFLVDMFKVRGKFALTDAYEDHFALPKGRIVLITHRRVILLQQPSNLIAQKKFNPARDPCSVVWDVVWDDLVTMELIHGKRDHPIAPPSRAVLYLQSKFIDAVEIGGRQKPIGDRRSSPLDAKDQHRIIKCNRDSNQAFEVYSLIELARSAYGPTQSMGCIKSKVTRPYSPMIDASTAKGGFMLSPQNMPSPLSLSSTLGALNTD